MDVCKKDLFCTKCSFTFGNTHIKLVQDIESNLMGSKNEAFESESKFQPCPDLDEQIVSVHHEKNVKFVKRILLK